MRWILINKDVLERHRPELEPTLGERQEDLQGRLMKLSEDSTTTCLSMSDLQQAATFFKLSYPFPADSFFDHDAVPWRRRVGSVGAKIECDSIASFKVCQLC